MASPAKGGHPSANPASSLATHPVLSAMEQERHAVSSVARLPAPGHIGAMPEPVILVDNLVKRYGSTLAVDGISFAVGRGVTTALLGGNRSEEHTPELQPHSFIP